jgi:hypothetical protein
MNVFEAVQWGRSLFEKATTSVAGVDEPTPGALWKKAYLHLEDALEPYGKIEFGTLPESSLIPFRETKSKCQKELGEILEQLLVVLGACGASGVREQIRQLEQSIETARQRTANIQRLMISAPPEKFRGPLDGILSPSLEHLKEDLEHEQKKIENCVRQIESLKAEFRERLKGIGVYLPDEQVDSYLLEIEEDLVAMAAVIHNVGTLTEQLEALVDQSREAPEETLRYYGCYVLLVLAVDRLECHFITRVTEELLPRIKNIEEISRAAIADASGQIARGGPIDILAGNIGANKTTIDGCQYMAEVLTSQKKAIGERNSHTKKLLAAAVNTYKTAKNSGDLIVLIGKSHSDFQALRDLSVPPMRAFQNIQLSQEMRRLSERVGKGDQTGSLKQ